MTRPDHTSRPAPRWPLVLLAAAAALGATCGSARASEPPALPPNGAPPAAPTQLRVTGGTYGNGQLDASSAVPAVRDDRLHPGRPYAARRIRSAAAPTTPRPPSSSAAGCGRRLPPAPACSWSRSCSPVGRRCRSPSACAPAAGPAGGGPPGGVGGVLLHRLLGRRERRVRGERHGQRRPAHDRTGRLVDAGRPVRRDRLVARLALHAQRHDRPGRVGLRPSWRTSWAFLGRLERRNDRHQQRHNVVNVGGTTTPGMHPTPSVFNVVRAGSSRRWIESYSPTNGFEWHSVGIDTATGATRYDRTGASTPSRQPVAQAESTTPEASRPRLSA